MRCSLEEGAAAQAWRELAVRRVKVERFGVVGVPLERVDMRAAAVGLAHQRGSLEPLGKGLLDKVLSVEGRAVLQEPGLSELRGYRLERPSERSE